MTRTLATIGVVLFLWEDCSAGHCYSQPTCGTCIKEYGAGACGWCPSTGQCGMAYDDCPTDDKLVTTTNKPSECPEPVVVELPGEDFFEDISSQLKFNPDQRNYGVAVTDINNDGKFDFVVAGFGSRNLAYTWNAETSSYDEIASKSLQDSKRKAIGLAACDIDGDGYEELYVLNTDQYSGDTTTSDGLFDLVDGEHIDLFTEPRNKDSGNFVAGRSCACLDRNASGKYGVAVANYGGDLKLFEVDYSGNSEGVLYDAAPEAGMDLRLGGRALVAGPIVSERTDLFANNEVDYSGADSRGRMDRANYMFVSNGDGTFEEKADDLGVADPMQTGRGTALFDANGDGLIDIVYGNWQGQHRLYIQERDGDSVSFTDAATAEMKFPSKIRTVIAADFDNDGYEELFWNNIPGDNRLFRKLPTDDDWVQINIGDAVEPEGMGTGGAVGDFDGDGMLELVVAHGESGPLQPLSLYRSKTGQKNHYLRVFPRNINGAPARGSRVDLTADGRTQLRVIDSGSGYLCQMEPVAHFGLGKLASFDATANVRVQWPDGSVCEFAPMGVDVEITVHQPATKGDECSVEYPEGYEEKLAADCVPLEPPTDVVSGKISWTGKRSKDLWDQYDKIFKSYNRNAASHLWASFLLDRSESMDADNFTFMFQSFCPVSGSPVSPSDMKRYGMEVPLAAPAKEGGATTRFGSMYFCCSPCVCDTLDFIRVDSKTVTVKKGKSTEERSFWFTVIANPCEDESKLSEEYTDPFRGRKTNVLQQAPELKCDANGNLVGAVMSDHGYPIIGMLHDSVEVTESIRAEIACDPEEASRPGRVTDFHPEGSTGTGVYQSHCEYRDYCEKRAKDGFNSGMGEIFRRVSDIGTWHPTCAAPAAPEPSDEDKEDDKQVEEPITKRPCEDSSKLRLNTIFKGQSKKTKAASICDCEDICLEKNAWAIAHMPNAKRPEKGRCTCYTKKRKRVKTKSKKGYFAVEL